MPTLDWVQSASAGGQQISPNPAYPPAACDAMTPQPDYRQLLWYTLSTVVLTALTILLIASFQ